MLTPEQAMDLMSDPFRYSDWQERVGAEEAGRQLTEAARALMQRDGPRAILEFGEKADDLIARMEEFSLGNTDTAGLRRLSDAADPDEW